jgi:hypothetical protein
MPLNGVWKLYVGPLKLHVGDHSIVDMHGLIAVKQQFLVKKYKWKLKSQKGSRSHDNKRTALGYIYQSKIILNIYISGRATTLPNL